MQLYQGKQFTAASLCFIPALLAQPPASCAEEGEVLFTLASQACWSALTPSFWEEWGNKLTDAYEPGDVVSFWVGPDEGITDIFVLHVLQPLAFGQAVEL